ncbi:MAG: hypothetical protein JWP84_3671 [Tardiphaga sp.]|nr:hypothetical protein [Tardiphaga sp.]
MKRGLRNFSATEMTDLVGGHRKLTVNGEVETRNSNETPSLVEASPPGINPKILILDVKVSTSDAGNDVMGWKEVAPFVKSISHRQYTDVTIRTEENEETIGVTEVFS